MSKAAKRERQRINREARRQAEEQWMKRRRMLRLARNIAIPIVIVVIAAVVINIVRDDGSDKATEDVTETTAPSTLPEDCVLDAPPPMEIDPEAGYVATVETSEGTFEIALDAAQAPQTVNAFVYQARNGCYDGLTFHRVAQDFVIQGGDPAGDGTGDFGYKTPDEPPADGYPVGSVAMANSGRETSGSQFFVVLSEMAGEALVANGAAQAAQDGGSEFLYSILGQVIDGMETVEAIGAFAPPEGDGPPTTPVTIVSITVTENGEPLGPTSGDEATDDTLPTEELPESTPPEE
jgi:cyclophilin family peptidyl-prolyl cis-trans isomerase